MKPHQYLALAGYLWIAWAVYWAYSGKKTKVEIYRQSAGARALHMGQLLLSFLLLFADHLYVGPFVWQLWPQNNFTGAPGLLITALGIAFMIWARLHLADNWSATVTLKLNHELVQTGPYGLVRHPIYTGFIAAIFGVMVICGQLRGVIALVIVIYSFSAKMNQEEDLMRKQFPAAYLEYAEKVKKIIPFLF